MSYDLIGFKWGASDAGSAGGVVTWSGDFVTSLNHSSAYTDQDFVAALQDAFDRWESVASIDFQQVASGGDILIGTADYSGGIAGVASYSIFARPGFDAVDNTSLSFDISDRLWSPGTGGFGESNFYAVALHEIGHLMRLAHPSPIDTAQIMNETIFVNDLGDGDIEGAQFLYGLDPGDEELDNPPSGGGGTSFESVGDGGSSSGGLLLGLLAALLGLFLGGGAAAVAVVAGRLPSEDDDEESLPEDDLELADCGHDHGAYAYGELIQHPVYLPVASMDAEPSPCGCYSACDCLMEQAYEEASLI
jgi:hypothetical protein